MCQDSQQKSYRVSHLLARKRFFSRRLNLLRKEGKKVGASVSVGFRVKSDSPRNSFLRDGTTAGAPLDGAQPAAICGVFGPVAVGCLKIGRPASPSRADQISRGRFFAAPAAFRSNNCPPFTPVGRRGRGFVTQTSSLTNPKVITPSGTLRLKLGPMAIGISGQRQVESVDQSSSCVRLSRSFVAPRLAARYCAISSGGPGPLARRPALDSVKKANSMLHPVSLIRLIPLEFKPLRC